MHGHVFIMALISTAEMSDDYVSKLVSFEKALPKPLVKHFQGQVKILATLLPVLFLTGIDLSSFRVIMIFLKS